MADIRTISKERCCGCAACVSACPADAISMEEGEEDFYSQRLTWSAALGAENAFVPVRRQKSSRERKKRCPVLQRPPKMPCA